MPEVKEIAVTEIHGLKIGNAQDDKAMPGATVLLFENGARAGVDVSGGGPASRETPLASPLTADNPVHAIVLSGGSAFGLAAGDGVMRYLEGHGIGFDTGFAKVPLVLQSCIYDLGLGRADIRPNSQMGYQACEDAQKGHPRSGPDIGAGTGATVGKLYGMDRAMKSGLGMYAVALGDLQMAAIVVVNALGDIIDPSTGKTIAGLRDATGTGFSDTCEEMYKMSLPIRMSGGNTTIGAIVTNAELTKGEMNKVASMTRCAYARCIRPVGTMADGDTIYAASVGGVKADLNMVGTLAAQVMEKAILRAVRS